MTPSKDKVIVELMDKNQRASVPNKNQPKHKIPPQQKQKQHLLGGSSQLESG